LVPDTRATRRPAASLRKAAGSTAKVVRPPMIDLSPMPSRRDSLPVQDPVHTATRPRPDPAAAESLRRRPISGTIPRRLLMRALVGAEMEAGDQQDHWKRQSYPGGPSLGGFGQFGRLNLPQLQSIIGRSRRRLAIGRRARDDVRVCFKFALTRLELTAIGVEIVLSHEPGGCGRGGPAGIPSGSVSPVAIEQLFRLGGRSLW